jgi:hypothetical protein
MRSLAWIAVLVLAFGSSSHAFSSPQPPQSGEELQITENQVGHYGGTLVVAQGTERENAQSRHRCRRSLS